MNREEIQAVAEFVEDASCWLTADPINPQRDDIIRMAREAGVLSGYDSELFQRFAELVAAAEREAFVALVYEMDGPDGIVPTDDLLAAIRARKDK